MAVELANNFSKGSIYLVDPLTPLVTCPQCGNQFIAQYSATIEEFVCNNCGHKCDPNFLHRGKRPVLVIQNPSYDFLNTITVIPITSQPKAKGKIGAIFIAKGKPSGLDKDSWALVWQVRTLNKNVFFKENYLGKVSSKVLNQINSALRKHLLL